MVLLWWFLFGGSYLLVQLIEDAKLQAVLDEERQHVLYGEPMLHILFRFADGLQENLSRDHVLLLARAQEVVLVEVVDAVKEALVLNVVRFCNGLLEGACCEVKLGGGVAEVGGDLVAALVLDPLWVKLKSFAVVEVGGGQVHDVNCLQVAVAGAVH